MKSYICNKSRSEGSLAKRYLVEECMTFVSEHLKRVEISINRSRRNKKDIVFEVDARTDIIKNTDRELGLKKLLIT